MFQGENEPFFSMIETRTQPGFFESFESESYNEEYQLELAILQSIQTQAQTQSEAQQESESVSTEDTIDFEDLEEID
jgi:hypothetical protein